MLLSIAIRMLIWQLAINSHMIGLETSVTLQIILEIANIQTLGVPIEYSSIPGLLSAIVGIVFIPALGIVIDRWGQTRAVKVNVLTFTTVIDILGAAAICLANGFALYYDSIDGGAGNATLVLEGIKNTDSFYNATRFLHLESHDTVTQAAGLDTPWNTFSATDAPGSESEGLSWMAYLNMVGYFLVNVGYDASICFAKIFVLDCTPAEHHPSVLVKMVVVSSIGGIVLAVLGSIDLGSYLAAGTDLDPSKTFASFAGAFTCAVLIIGYIITLVTGFFWKAPVTDLKEDQKKLIQNEKKDEETGSAKAIDTQDTNSALLSPDHNSSGANHEERRYQDKNSTNLTDNGEASNYRTFESNGQTTSEIPSPQNGSDPETESRPEKSGLLSAAWKYRKQILITFMTFLMFSSNFCFELYAVNFVGVSIFGGAPDADPDSEAFQAYEDGIAVGSQGTLIYCVSFAVFSLVQEKLLEKFGWKLVTVLVMITFGALCVAAALTLNVWVYYVTNVLQGVMRAVVYSVPFILANQVTAEQGDEKHSSTIISIISAMLPGGFIVSTASMAPLINFTDDAAAPVYASCVSGLLSGLFACFINIKTEFKKTI